jgi:hypothetical protein
MRGRIAVPAGIVASVVLAVIAVLVAWSAGRSTPPAAGGEPAAGAVSNASTNPTAASRPPVRSAHPRTAPPARSDSRSASSRPNTTPVVHRRLPPRAKPTSYDAPATGPVRFGQVTVSKTSDASIAPDGRALTVRFSDAEVSLADNRSASSTAKLTVPLALPLTHGAQAATIRVYASGYAFTEGATARLSLSANGRQVVSNFSDGSDEEYVEELELPAIPSSAIHLSLILELHQLGGSTQQADGYLNAASLDAELI